MSETEQQIVTFIARAKADQRVSDVAYGNGALDALRNTPADGERFGSDHASYLAGWCAIHGI